MERIWRSFVVDTEMLELVGRTEAAGEGKNWKEAFGRKR
jgi:hypothetical protein